MYLFETCLYYLLQSKDGSNKQERNKNRQNHYHPPVRPVDAFFSLKPTWRFSLRLGSTNPFNFPMFIIIFEFLKNSRESLIMQFNSSNIIKKYCFFMVRYYTFCSFVIAIIQYIPNILSIAGPSFLMSEINRKII